MLLQPFGLSLLGGVDLTREQGPHGGGWEAFGCAFFLHGLEKFGLALGVGDGEFFGLLHPGDLVHPGQTLDEEVWEILLRCGAGDEKEGEKQAEAGEESGHG